MKKSDRQDENQQELVPLEVNLNDSEDELENIVSNIQALPNNSLFSELMTKTLGAIKVRPNSLSIKPTPSGANVVNTPIYALGGDTIRRKAEVYDLTPKYTKPCNSQIIPVKI